MSRFESSRSSVTVRYASQTTNPATSSSSFRRRPGADHPAGGGKTDFRSVHVGIKGGADRFDNLFASLLVRLVKDPTEGTEPAQVTEQLLLGKAASNIDRPGVDLGPAALLQEAADPALVREGELPRRVRSAGGDVRQERCRGALGR